MNAPFYFPRVVFDDDTVGFGNVRPYMLFNASNKSSTGDNAKRAAIESVCRDHNYCIGYEIPDSGPVKYFKYDPTSTYNVNTKNTHIFVSTLKKKIHHDPRTGLHIQNWYEIDCSDRSIFKVARTIEPDHVAGQPYEERPHGSSGGNSGGGCFPASALVQLENGSKIRMDKLKIGDYIKTRDGFSKVYMFLHYLPNVTENYFKINNKLEISENHFISVNSPKKFIRSINIKIGDIIFINNKHEKVKSINKIKNTGLYAPVTFDGNLIVDDILVSSYATYKGNHSTVLPLIGEIINGNLTVHIGISPIRLINRIYSCFNNISHNKYKNHGYHDLIHFYIENKFIPTNSEGNFQLLHPSFLLYGIFCALTYILDAVISFFIK